MVSRADDEARNRWHHDAIARLSAALQEAPDAPVSSYPEWTLRDHVVHVIRVHVMACERLRTDVDACPHSAAWVPTPTSPSLPMFWRRRMLSESVLHRGDAEAALGRSWAPGHGLVEEVIDEFPVSRVDPLVGEALRASVALDVGSAQWSVAVAGDGTATVSADPVHLWLWLNRRADSASVEDTGSGSAVAEREASLDGLRSARR